VEVDPIPVELVPVVRLLGVVVVDCPAAVAFIGPAAAPVGLAAAPAGVPAAVLF
jgi:hypothetical protein